MSNCQMVSIRKIAQPIYMATIPLACFSLATGTHYSHLVSNSSMLKRRLIFLVVTLGVAILVESHNSAANQVHHQSTKHRSLNPSIGQFRALVVLVRFTDHTTRDLPPVEHYETLCRQEIAPYLHQQSYGQYVVEDCDVFDWRTTDNTERFFADGVSGFKKSDEASAFFEPVLTQLDSEGLIDWLKYDLDRDGVVDSLSIIHSGYAAEQGLGSSCNEPHPIHRIFSQGHRSSMNGWTDPINYISVGGFSISSAFDRVCLHARPASMGVWAHEWIHTFGELSTQLEKKSALKTNSRFHLPGAPDLYDVGTRSSGKLGGLGLFDIMSNPFGPHRNGTPGSLSAFTKHQIDWMAPTVIKNDGTYTIRNSNVYPDFFQIKEGFPDGEYLLIENRAAEGFDDGMPGAGIVIYHVDLAIPAQDRAGYPGQPGWPQNGNHYRVAILPADGQYDIEQNVNNGDSGDFWTKGQVLGPSNGQPLFPNTDSYQNGVIQSTEIRIHISSDPGIEMTMEVSGLGKSFMAQPLPTPSPALSSARVPVASPSIQPANRAAGQFHWEDKEFSGPDTTADQDTMVGTFDFMSTLIEQSPSPSPMNLGNTLGYASLRTDQPVGVLGHAALNTAADPSPTGFQESGTFVFGNEKDVKGGDLKGISDSARFGTGVALILGPIIVLVV